MVFLLVLQLRRLVRISMWSCDERKRIREEAGLGNPQIRFLPHKDGLPLTGPLLGLSGFSSSTRRAGRRGTFVPSSEGVDMVRLPLCSFAVVSSPECTTKSFLSSDPNAISLQQDIPNQFSLGSSCDSLQQQARGFSVRECSLPLFPFIL